MQNYKKILKDQITYLYNIVSDMSKNLTPDAVFNRPKDVNCYFAYGDYSSNDPSDIERYFKEFTMDEAEIENAPFLLFQYKEATVAIENLSYFLGDFCIRCEMKCIENLVIGGRLESIIEAIDNADDSYLREDTGIHWVNYDSYEYKCA